MINFQFECDLNSMSVWGLFVDDVFFSYYYWYLNMIGQGKHN